MRETVSSGLRMMLMLNVPATVGLMVAGHADCRADLRARAASRRRDTAATAAALAFYAPGLVGYSAVKIAVPSFYALRDSRTPVIVSAATVLLNVVLNLTLVRVMGFTGLALGTAVSAIFNAAVLLWLLRSRLDGIDARRVAGRSPGSRPRRLVMGLAAWAADAAIAAWMPSRSIPVMALRVAAGIAVALVVLDRAARLLHAQEFNEARSMVLARLRPRTRRT